MMTKRQTASVAYLEVWAGIDRRQRGSSGAMLLGWLVYVR